MVNGVVVPRHWNSTYLYRLLLSIPLPLVTTRTLTYFIIRFIPPISSLSRQHTPGLFESLKMTLTHLWTGLLWLRFPTRVLLDRLVRIHVTLPAITVLWLSYPVEWRRLEGYTGLSIFKQRKHGEFWKKNSKLKKNKRFKILQVFNSLNTTGSISQLFKPLILYIPATDHETHLSQLASDTKYNKLHKQCIAQPA